MRHSPGPWRFVFWQCVGNGGPFLTTAQKDPWVWIAGAEGDIIGGDFELETEEDIANANLVVVAPELLELLEAIIGYRPLKKDWFSKAKTLIERVRNGSEE